MADLTHIQKEEGRNIQICWRADLTGFGSVKFKETQRRACTYYPAHLPYLNLDTGLFTGAGACVDGVAEAAGRATEEIKRRG